MERSCEATSENVIDQSQSQSNPSRTEDCNKMNGSTIPESTHGFATPVAKGNPVEMSDLTKTFTRKSVIPKDTSSVTDNSINVESATPRTGTRSSRQKTMTVDTSGLARLRKMFADAKQSGTSLDDLETKAVDLFQIKDAENNARLAKAAEKIERLEKQECINNEANLMVYRALISEYQMMVDELTSGKYIHVGRLEEYGYTKSNGCAGACKAATERDSLKADLDSMHEDYSKLFESYKKIRKIAEEQKMEFSTLHDKFLEKIDESKALQGKMSRLREDAQKKLEQASKDMADCLRERDESLLGLKLKVRQLEMDNKSCQRELEIKKNEAAELRDICDQLMRQVEPGSDVEQ